MKTQKLYSKLFDSFAEWNGSAWEDKNIPGTYFYTLEKAANNGYLPIEEKSDREKAIEWWNELIPNQRTKILLVNKMISRAPSLTGREIEHIWRKETQQELERGITITRAGERTQVDFELLKIQVIDFVNDESYTIGARNNLKLFFELLSKSSTFAHKAHKELNKLIK